MFSKPISQLAFQDIYDLVYVHKAEESTHLDYKGEPRNLDSFANKLIKLFSSFSNSSGGYVVLGVDEVDNKEKSFVINGVSKVLQGKNVIEWLNQTLHGNIEPKITYSDPAIIEIPEKEKVVLVYHVPESDKKPHYNRRDNKYYVRRNDISEPASHYLIRDMFDYSRMRNNEFKEFLAKRNLFDTSEDSFCLNESSSQVISPVFNEQKVFPQPLLVYSLIPKRPNDRLKKLYEKENMNWILSHNRGFQPYKSLTLFSNYPKEYNLDGVRFRNVNNLSSIELHNSGYIESSLCDSVFWIWRPNVSML